MNYRLPSSRLAVSGILPLAFVAVGLGFLYGCSSADEASTPVEPPAPTGSTASSESLQPSGGSPEGLDVSHHDGAVDWAQVKAAGLSFAYIKATEGIDFTDPLFTTNWNGAESAGILRGAYHFYRPQDDGETQAHFFLSVLGDDFGELLPVVDVEIADGKSGAEIIAGVGRWLEVVEEATGVAPMIYTDVGFWNGLETKDLASYPLWVAEYDVDSPTLPGGWSDWALWQYTQEGNVPGVAQPVDRNRAKGPSAPLFIGGKP